MVISGTDVEQLLNLIMRYYQKSEFTEILEASCQLNYDRVSNGSCYRYGVYNSIINCEHLGQNPFQRFISAIGNQRLNEQDLQVCCSNILTKLSRNEIEETKEKESKDAKALLKGSV
jgi:hypothetical protein